jgi:FMN phosphatase YigB (HAD superfamily)
LTINNYSKPEFIYFDLDNTLLNHSAAERKALEDVRNHFEILSGVNLEDWQQKYHEVNSHLWDRYGKHEIDRKYLHRHRFEDTLESLGLDGSNYEEMGTFYMERYPFHWQWMEGARNAYYSIVSEYEVGILTNGFSETQRKKFDKFKFGESATHLVISEDTGYMKPQPQVFEYATRLAGTNPESILYIGDSYTSDIKGATQIGWKTAWFTNDNDPDKMSDADIVFDDFNDLMSIIL